MNFVNSYASLPEVFFSRVETDKAPQPELFAWNQELADHLGFEGLGDNTSKLASIFSGSEPLPGGETIALAYAGHQFGHFVPQLGDGRAALIGEIVSPADSNRYDIQLKGSGPTPYSRRGDGKSSLGPVIREYLLSEAMHRLGVPTTRALAAVSTGETVYRESMEPGGVLTRVAASHIRVGTFQYFAASNQREALKQLADYAIARHYPEAALADNPVPAFYSQVVEAQARLIAHWMAFGFIHGVMNTDNCAISGETLDYGPCAFMDEFDIDKVFSSIDRQGRYAYGQQATMAQWNLARLAECLMQLDGDKAVYEAALESFQFRFEETYFSLMRNKLGLAGSEDGDVELITAWLQHLQDHQLDYSQGYIRLSERIGANDSAIFGEFETRWLQRVDRQPGGPEKAMELMASANPVVIPRNHQVERAIEAAFRGDFTVFDELRKVLDKPFVLQEGYQHYSIPPLPEERVERTFCGT